MFTKSLLPLAAAGALVLAAGSASAATYTTTSQTAFASLGGNQSVGSTSDQVNWGLFAASLGISQPNNASIATGASTTTPGNDVVTVASGDGNGFVTYVEGKGTAPTNSGRTHTAGTAWDGLFTAGDTILASTSDTITLSFQTPLIGLGIAAQMFNAGSYTETLTAYNSSNQLLTSVTNTGTSTGASMGITSAEGTVPFVGISTDAQNNAASLASAGISFITISVTCTASPNCNTSGFAINTSVLYHYPISSPSGGNTQTPEPGTLGLLGAGLAGLGLVRRRRSQV